MTYFNDDGTSGMASYGETKRECDAAGKLLKAFMKAIPAAIEAGRLPDPREF